MTPREMKNWLLVHLEMIEPEIGRPPSEREAAILREAKTHMYRLGHYRFCLTLPDLIELKTPTALCAQLRLCLAQLEKPTPPVDGGAMSVAQAAGLLGVSKETVYKLCAEGSLPHTRIGTRITITPDQLAEYRQLQGR